MTIETPTTKDINDSIIARLEASFNQTIPLLAKSFMRVFSKVFAGIVVILYKYGGFIFLQQFVQTASFKDTTILGKVVNPLKFWGRVIGVGDPIAATSAEFGINITVTQQTGSLPSGSQLVSNENGVTYITIGDVSLNAPTVQAVVSAASDQSGGDGSGSIGNLDIGSILSFVNPLANVAKNTAIYSQSVQGADAESEASYRQRVITRFQQKPQGGALADYVDWGLDVAGIVNIYDYRGTVPCEVDVYVEVTPASSGDPDGIPTQAQLDAVYDSIQLDENGLATRRPVSAFVNTFPITRDSFDVKVTGLDVSNEASVKDQIDTALIEHFLDREPFIDGLSRVRKDAISNSAVGGIVQDIVAANQGVYQGTITEINSVAITLVLLDQGAKAKLGTLTYL